MTAANSHCSNAPRGTLLPAAAAAGFVAAFAQMVLLRELLALFSGFELPAGLFLAFWLIWTALGSRLAAEKAQAVSPQPLLLGLAVLLPLTLLLLRATRPLWNIPMGEMPGLGIMLAICALSPALFCLCSGALFAVCWARVSQTSCPRPMRVYLAEGLGSGLAGLLLFFMFLPLFSVLQSVLIVACMLTALAVRLVANRTRFLPPLLLLPVLLLALAPQLTIPLDRLTRTWQWGTGYVAGQESPYQSLAVCRQSEQLSLFSDGSWLFSLPDLLSTEFALEPVLLLHPHPKSILLLGGNPLELPAQARKHPQLDRITMVEQDPAIPVLLHRVLKLFPIEQTTVAEPLATDPAILLRRPGKQYDIILLQLGAPSNAGRNRYYTLEFFQDVKKRLAPGGLFSFTAPGAPEAVGPVQARLLRSLNATLQAVFPLVLALPGDQIRFVASSDTSYAAIQPDSLLQRLHRRNIPTRFFRAQSVRELFSPFKREYLRSVLEDSPAPELNRNFRPACYLDTLLAWGRQLDERLFVLLERFSHGGQYALWILVGCGGLLLALGPLVGKASGLSLAVGAAVALTGACLMIWQFFLLLVFQIMSGSLYSRLALLVAASMTGLAMGAWLTPQKRPVLRTLLGVQSLFCLLLAAFAPLFDWLQTFTPALPAGIILAVCMTLALAGGALGGLHFGLSSRLLEEKGRLLAGLGGKLYALDLAGAAGGSLLVSLLLLPLYGLQSVLLAAAMLCAASVCGLFLTGRKR